MKAIWNGEVIAESNETIVVENNHYFPKESIKTEYFTESKTKTNCPWKGVASYYDVEVIGVKNDDAAWYYPDPKAGARKITNHVAFWKGVTVTK